MQDEAGDVAIEKFVRLKPKMVDDNSQHEKEKEGNKNVVATISHNDYKYVLLKKKMEAFDE